MKAEEVKRGVGTRLSSLSRSSAPTATTQPEPWPLAILNSSVIVMLRLSTHDLRESGWQEVALKPPAVLPVHIGHEQI